MSRWIALLRGINVGGNNILPMKDLRNALEHAGLGAVKTYIQSGNCVFDADTGNATQISARIADLIDADFGFRPRVLVLSAAELVGAIDANPFAQAQSDPKTLHMYFLASTPLAPDLAAISTLQAGSEQVHLGDNVFYLFAPDGIGRSRLAAKVETLLGVPATARNLRSVMAIAALAT